MTKQAVLRANLALLGTADWIVVIDPDIELNCQNWTTFIQRLQVGTDHKVMAAAGRINSADSHDWISDLVFVDKFWSHAVVRPTLWRLGLGASLPGQVLALRPVVIEEAQVDSYLDDLQFGLRARGLGRVLLTKDQLGTEMPAASFRSLLAQRIRWMKGLFQLFAGYRRSPLGLGLLSVHFVAYHLLPVGVFVSAMLAASGQGALSLLLPLMAASTLTAWGVRSPTRALRYWLVMPLLHLFVLCAWWLPFGWTALQTRRGPSE